MLHGTGCEAGDLDAPMVSLGIDDSNHEHDVHGVSHDRFKTTV